MENTKVLRFLGKEVCFMENFREKLTACVPNEGKTLVIETRDYGKVIRYPVKTHVVMSNEDIFALMDRYVTGKVKSDDYVFISEKVIAICQGPVDDGACHQGCGDCQNIVCGTLRRDYKALWQAGHFL